MEVLHEMVDPDNINYGKSFVLGSSFELGVAFGQLDEDFINSLKMQPTFNPLSFAREYESVWTGTSDNSFVTLENLEKCRVLKKAELKADTKDKTAEYILAYDVARSEGKSNASSALSVLKILPRGDGTYQKHLVNVFEMEGTHFLDQALFVKQKVEEFKARILVVDANGLGSGLVDQLILEIDEHPPYAVVNDSDYDKYKKENSIPILYALKSSKKETKNSDIHNHFMNTIANQRVKMLQSESQARSFVKGKDSEGLARELMPFIMTDLLCDEIMNLEYKQSGSNTDVKRISSSINKDKFSSFEYALYYVYLLERDNVKRRRESADVSKFFAVKQGKLTKW